MPKQGFVGSIGVRWWINKHGEGTFILGKQAYREETQGEPKLNAHSLLEHGFIWGEGHQAEPPRGQTLSTIPV